MTKTTTAFAQITPLSFAYGLHIQTARWSLCVRYDCLVVIMLLCCGLLWLGQWQLSKWTHRQQSPPTTSSFIMETAPKHHLLLENQPHDGKRGFRVLMRFEDPTQPKKSFLVDRGWLPQGSSRETLPEIPPITLPATLTGHWYPAWKNPFLSYPSDIKWTSTDPVIRLQNLDLDYLAQLWHHELRSDILKLTADSKGTLTYLEGHAHRPPERHLGYAVQWFGLAFTLVIGSLMAGARWEKK